MTQRIPMTERGAERLKKTLHTLKTQTRLQKIKEIEKARAHGDLKENGEYHAAKEEQGFVERQISEIESKLAQCQIINPARLPQNGKVMFGATLHLINTKNDEKVIYQIVGEDEADIKDGKISFNSPIARALIGKEIGEYIEVNTPGGLASFEINEIEYI